MTFDERATIPDKLNDFYEQAFATLFNVHDGSKDCFRRNIKTSLGCEDFKQIFAYFCFKSYFNSDFRFTESSVRTYITQSKQKIDPLAIWTTDDYLDDLIHAVCMLVKDGLYYTFSHRSFQEYFAALYTTKLLDDVQRRLIQGWLTENKVVDFVIEWHSQFNMVVESSRFCAFLVPLYFLTSSDTNIKT